MEKVIKAFRACMHHKVIDASSEAAACLLWNEFGFEAFKLRNCCLVAAGAV
jgi:hypothetical protein